jgi:hypothetical protein
MRRFAQQHDAQNAAMTREFDLILTDAALSLAGIPADALSRGQNRNSPECG